MRDVADLVLRLWVETGQAHVALRDAHASADPMLAFRAETWPGAHGGLTITAALVAACREVFADPSAANVITAGTQLFKALPPPVQEALQDLLAPAFRDNDPASLIQRRLLVEVVESTHLDAPGRRLLAQLRALPWELLAVLPKERPEAGEEPHQHSTPVLPLLAEHWHVVRHEPRDDDPQEPVLLHGRPGVLILVGNPAQRAGRRNPSADLLETLAAVRAGVADSAPAVVIAIAAPVRDTWLRGALADAHRQMVQAAQPLTLPGDALALLRRGFEIVHFLGHSSDPYGEGNGDWWAGATALDLGFTNAAGPMGIAADDVEKALASTRTRILVLHACNGRAVLAQPLLAAVPHVVTLGATTPIAACAPWSRAFYAGLTASSVGDAVLAARKAIDPALRWIPWHWARSRDARPFQTTAGVALLDYGQRLRADLDQDVPLLLPAGREHLYGGKLPAVYVRVSLADHTGAIGDCTLHDLVILDAQARRRLGVPDGLRRIVVRGDPGSGKSTMLTQVAREWIDDPVGARVPIVLHLPTWVAGADVDPEQCVAAKYSAITGLEAALRQPDVQRRIVYLLDSLDEVPPAQRPEARRRILNLTTRAGTIVVATRGIGYERIDPATFREVDAQEWGRVQKREFLERWFSLDPERGPAWAERALTQVEATRRLERLSGIPLFLTLMAILLTENVERRLPDLQGVLLDEIVDFLLAGKHQREPVPMPDVPLALAALEALAVAWTKRAEGERGAELTADEKQIALWLHESTPSVADPTAYVNLLAQRTRILGPVRSDAQGRSAARAKWKFWHRIFGEHFVARWLAGEIRATGAAATIADLKKAAQQRPQDPFGFWAEPAALVTSRLDAGEARAWIEALLADPDTRVLGFRALANAEQLDRDLLEQALASLSAGRREEGRRLFPLLPELLGDAQAAIEVLAASARTTTDGDDLWAIDATLAGLEATAPAFASEAAGARARLFVRDEEPTLDALWSAFAWVPGDEHREKRLWCPIPGGETVLGDVGHERRVRIEQPFWMGAVTVTEQQYSLFDPTRAVTDQRLPAVRVTSHAASMFCRWLTRQLGRLWDAQRQLPGFEHRESCPSARLPDKDEWEHATRAGSRTRFWSGDRNEDLVGVGWHLFNSGNRVHRVAELRANGWGLYDVHGNVWEWCADEVGAGGERTGSGARRVRRGGSYWVDARGCRSGYRDGGGPDNAWDVGFRVCLSAPNSGMEAP